MLSCCELSQATGHQHHGEWTGKIRIREAEVEVLEHNTPPGLHRHYRQQGNTLSVPVLERRVLILCVTECHIGFVMRVCGDSLGMCQCEKNINSKI